MGFAEKLPPNEVYTVKKHVAGTRDYIGPETLSSYVIEEGVINVEKTKKRKVKIYLQSDIWALGVILHQWVYDALLYSTVPGGKLSKIYATIDKKPVELEPLQDLDLYDTLRLCLNKNPLKRPSVDKLLRHPYLHPAHRQPTQTIN